MISTYNVNLFYPANLEGKITEFDRKAQLFVSTLTKKTLKSLSDRKSLYIELHSDKLIEYLGKFYRRTIDGLIAANVITVLKNRAKGVETYEKGKFCKRYRLAPKYINDLQKGKVKSLRYGLKVNVKTRKFIETAQIDNDVTLKISENIKKINVDLNNLTQNQLFLGMAINAGITGIRQSKKTGRVYHNVLRSRDLRHNMSAEGERLVQIDASQCHVRLLAGFITNTEERAAYIEWITQNDLYANIAAKVNICPGYYVTRKDMKADFQRFLAGSRNSLPARNFTSFFSQRFPTLWAWIQEKSKLTKQAQLQKLEADIFIFSCVKNADFFCVPVHDCLMVKESDATKAKELINFYSNKFIGLDLCE